MTREEAIQWLTNEKWTNANNKYKKEWNEAFDRAIEALTHEIRTETHGVCLISKDDAIEAVAQQWLFEASVGNPYVNDDDIGEYRKLAEELFEDVPSAEAVQGEWIPCSKKMPKELERVNITWLNHNPPFYYQHIKDIPQTDTAVYYRGKWYWWDATVIDVLAEYGEDYNAEQIDKDIEVVAWMPLPKPYKGVAE